jgi:chemotaxis protein MotB
MSGNCPECEEGLPEWIMSYADMITILMAFFVVMYSMAGAPKDKTKEEAVMRSLRERFGPNWPGLAALGPDPYGLQDATLRKIAGGGSKTNSRKTGGADTKGPPGEHSRVYTLHAGQQSAVGGVLYFPEASSDLTKDHLQQLRDAYEEISGKPQKIEIRGHTSRRPLPKGSPYRDNWDLAYARCRHTMEQLIALGVNPKRLRLSVAADNEPVAARADPLARSENSRVEMYMLNEVVDRPPQSHDSNIEPPNKPTPIDTRSQHGTPE